MELNASENSVAEFSKEAFLNLRDKKDAVILGIESSCDETAAAVVAGGRRILSNVISTQIDIHRLYGGVVPEIASRNHIKNIPAVVDGALKQSGLKMQDIDAFAVTYGAGLLGALLVGVSYAKGLSYALNKPLIKVNHIEAHIAANFCQFENLTPPFIALVASGGHTSIVDVEDFNKYELIGHTSDDAIGEAFDKVARMLGLPYPGGPEIDRLAKEGKPVIDFFKARKEVKSDFSLSYSGLKTAVVNYLHNAQQRKEEINIPDVCASLNKAAVDMAADTALAAVDFKRRNTLVLAGGVASNSYLRSHISECAERRKIKVFFPNPKLCTDNAVMVAARAYFSLKEGRDLADLSLNAVSALDAGER